MLKLNSPSVSYQQSVDCCKQGIAGRVESTRALKERLNDSTAQLISEETAYLASAATNELHMLPVCERDGNPIVVGRLTRDDLEKLYTEYLVSLSKPARQAIYDVIMNGANEECPFCGGIGVPNNLDHFLPKIHFPQYSLLPWNLVPSCEKCNMGEKGQAYASCAEEQFIHPYLDINQFFDEQWIYSKFEPIEEEKNGSFKYFVAFGDNDRWNEENRARAYKHFNDFNLAQRYSVQASRELRGVWGQLKAMLSNGNDKKIIIDCILTPKIDSAPHVNHWIVSMYQALIEWFDGVERETLIRLELLG